MMTDPIADMLTRVRNSLAVKKPEVVLPFSKIKYEIAKILKSAGYLESVEKVEDRFTKLKLVLAYKEGNVPAITHIKRISKPGLRVYVSRDKIPYVLNDLGIAILSTSRGLMTNKQARRGKVGGELICEVW
ncbi:MAG: 30S ribosomal protein S8 [Candidatus Komeilibacteria bacterium]|nr:30S ribosomal protein S8 [Candidatus Komeilibacteria bacterium]